jgi:hypothetical protein
VLALVGRKHFGDARRPGGRLAKRCSIGTTPALGQGGRHLGPRKRLLRCPQSGGPSRCLASSPLLSLPSRATHGPQAVSQPASMTALGLRGGRQSGSTPETVTSQPLDPRGASPGVWGCYGIPPEQLSKFERSCKYQEKVFLKKKLFFIFVSGSGLPLTESRR